MELATIDRNGFSDWKVFRQALYKDLTDADNEAEVQVMFNSDDWHCWFIKDEQGKNIGLVELASRNIVDGCLSSPVAYLEGLYLEPNYRCQGIGKQVIRKVLNWCRENNFTELATDTELVNSRAQKFYLQTGFEETDRIVQYRIDI